MAQNEIKTIKIKAIDSNDKFFNITGEDGIKYGVARDKSPNLCAILANAKPGDSVRGEYFFYKENHYFSDPKENKGGGNGKTFAPKDKSFEAAIAAFEGACTAFSLDKEKDNVKILDLAKLGHEFIMNRVTAPKS